MKDSSTKSSNQKNPKGLALEAAFSEIDRKFGKGSVMLLGDSPDQVVESISTGSLLLDKAVGLKGLPRGRIVEIFGPEASGKTTIALQVIAESQKVGGTCAFIDAEHALDTNYAEKLGINTNDLVISQPDFGEQALDIAEVLVRSGALDVIVIDSVAALVPKAELEGDMGDVHVGLQARLMSQALRKLTPLVHKSKTCLVFINQVRHKIDALPFGNKETTSGGNALKFYSSMRLDVRRIGALKKGDKHVGNKVGIRVVKNKLAAPFARVELDLIFGAGTSKAREVLDLALSASVIKQSGAWFSFEGEKIAQGRDACAAKLESDKEFIKKVYSLTLTALENKEVSFNGKKKGSS